MIAGGRPSVRIWRTRAAYGPRKYRRRPAHLQIDYIQRRYRLNGASLRSRPGPALSVCTYGAPAIYYCYGDRPRNASKLSMLDRRVLFVRVRRLPGVRDALLLRRTRLPRGGGEGRIPSTADNNILYVYIKQQYRRGAFVMTAQRE